MTSTATADDARLLFVINNDFGELSLAMLFVHGRGLASRTTVMLPPRLFKLNGGGLPVRTLPYASVDDLTRAIEAEAPDVVIFFSAYLLPAHGLISAAELERLLGVLRNRGCRVATSDPFWGLLTAPAPLPPRLKSLMNVAAALNDLVHLFLAPMELEGVCCVSFFNPSFVDARVAPIPDAFWHAAGVSRASSHSRFWLFPITGEDYNTQVRLSSKGRFADGVARLLEDALSAGRWPVLLAPAECIRGVASRFQYADAAALIPYCDLHLFTSLLVHAEHVFNWNAGSTSGHVRMLRGLSQFSFDSGHVGRVVEGWLQQTGRHYFCGRHLPGLDQSARLIPENLEERDAAFRPVANDIRRNLARAPTPEAMIARVLEGVEPSRGARLSDSRTGDPGDVGH